MGPEVVLFIQQLLRPCYYHDTYKIVRKSMNLQKLFLMNLITNLNLIKYIENHYDKIKFVQHKLNYLMFKKVKIINLIHEHFYVDDFE